MQLLAPFGVDLPLVMRSVRTVDLDASRMAVRARRRPYVHVHREPL
jgi:hypothetical protein